MVAVLETTKRKRTIHKGRICILIYHICLKSEDIILLFFFYLVRRSEVTDVDWPGFASPIRILGVSTQDQTETKVVQ